MDLALLDGTTVAARALGWDARDNDGTEWALFHSDLPALARLIGTLTVNYVDELGYTQYVVHGVPVDPGSITPADYVNEVEVLVAAGTSEGAKKAWLTRDRGARAIVQGQPSKEEFKKYLANVQPGEVPPFPLGPGQKAAITKKFQQIDAQVAADQAEWEATMAKIAAHNAEVAAEAAVVEAAVAQAQVDQFQYQQQLDLDAEPPPAEPVPADPSLVETTKSGKTQLTKEAFTDYLAVATADTIPPGPLGPGQKAAITKKLQAVALQADVAEANAIDAAAQANIAAETAAVQAEAAKVAVAEFGTPAAVVKPAEFHPSVENGPAPTGYVYNPTTGGYTPMVTKPIAEVLAGLPAKPAGPMSTPEFQAWIKTVQPGMAIETPGQLLPWQKAALTKKLKATEAPGAKPAPGSPNLTPEQQTEFEAKLGAAEQAGAKAGAKAKPLGIGVTTAKPAASKAPLSEITAKTKSGSVTNQAPPPPLVKQLTDATHDELVDYVTSTTGKPPIGTDVYTQAKNVAAQHSADNKYLAAIGYPASGLTAREARRAVLRETGERKPTGGPGSGLTAHAPYGATAISGLPRDKLEAIVTHHSGGLTTKASLKNIGLDELKKMAVTADKKYSDTVTNLTAKGFDPAIIPHSAHGATQLYLGKSKGLPPKPGAPTIKPPTKAQQAKLAKQQQAAAKKAQADAKKTPAQLAQKPANWGSMKPGEKSAWSKAYNLKAKGIYPPGMLSKSTHKLGSHTVNPYPTEMAAAKANNALVDQLAQESEAVFHASSTEYSKREKAFRNELTSTESSAWGSYYGGGYTGMNGCLKRGVGCTDAINAKNKRLTAAIKDHGSPAPPVLYRGKRQGTHKDFARVVGTEFEDPGFGSWAETTHTPKGFGGVGTTTSHSVFYRLVDSKGIRSAPSGSGERETILPPGTKFRVLAITDHVSGNLHHRVLDVEVIHKPFG